MNTYVGIICVPLYVPTSKTKHTKIRLLPCTVVISTLHSESSTGQFILSINFLVYHPDKHVGL